MKTLSSTNPQSTLPPHLGEGRGGAFPSPSPFGGGQGWGSFRLAWRTLRRDGLFSIVNIAGLSVGLTVVLIICAMIYNEYSFDKSFPDRDRIYRMNSVATEKYGGKTMGVTVNPFAPAVKEEVPEVAHITRTCTWENVIKVSDVFFKINKFCWADEDFFRIFETPFVYGSPETALLQPGSVALSESESRILFGDRNPIGEPILVDGQNQMVVQAVYKDYPANSSFADYDVIGQFMSSHLPITPRDPGSYHWGNVGFETFCLLATGADAAQAEKHMQQVLEKNVGPDGFFRVQLQPFEKIHLSGIEGTYTYAPSDAKRLKMLGLLAGIILIVACINYMNLSTARAQKRSKTIGINKTLGARRITIIHRLYAETGLVTLIAFVAALVFSIVLLPVFNKLSGQLLSPGIFLYPAFLLGILAVYLVTTFLAASYPALYLSGFAPLTIIQQGHTRGGRHAMIRKGLSVVQFSVAIVLVAWVLVIGSQMNYVTNKDLGFEAKGVMAIPLSAESSQNDFSAVKNDFASQGTVSNVALSSAFPVNSGPNNIFFKNHQVRQEFIDGIQPAADQISHLGISDATPEILDMLHLKLIAGTMYQERKAGDGGNQVVINRKAVEFLESTPDEILGKKIYAGGLADGEASVIGVIEDFNHRDLRNPIGPYCFQNSKNNYGLFLLLRTNEGNMSQQLASYEAIFKKHFPNDMFEVIYPSLLYQRAYESDRQTNRMAVCFSILAILVACMGVFGLTAFMAEQRTKEIGIRKVLGASVSSIVSLFTGNYLRLLLLSLVIAVPIAWWIGSKYLESFAYRISLSWWMFAAAALITVVLTLLTVSLQAIKAATANPVKAIKSE